MNEQEAGAWQKPKPFRHVLPSGRVCYLRRPSPALVLKTGKIQRLLSRMGAVAGQSAEEIGWAFLDTLSDEEAEKLATQAIDLILDVVVEPKLYREPKEDQLGVVDLGNDFWPLYAQGMALFRDQSVALSTGETTVAAVETFPDEPATEIVSSDDGSQFQGAPC